MARYTGKKFSRQDVQGMRMGARAAREVIKNHGCSLARHNHSQLKRIAHLRDRWDKAYTRAYGLVIQKHCRR